ncbi:MULTISPECIES: sodium/glutamate symporter [unclassified Microbacterium]|uniref:sodium/glutamate symporter n=1 Tax=unclassified Microbacterium TaxID=2609290 RepID=UPI00214C86C0|nr:MULTISPECIES: sodium/glutamate symporter [unclassified Microbacterium]MCR2785646.1 sodium:glutamate symporter [Microbacterium sp. zg.B96]WIM17369.1 sodium/glutamate symporter [Microbacterium sp. zg-B96]
MDYTPYTFLTDLGWISILLLVGKLVRAFVPFAQRLMLPSAMTAGILGVIFGPGWLDLIPFSDQLGTYSAILIAVVFAAMPYSESFGKVSKGARTMWAYSTAMYVLQWGLALLFSFTVLALFFNLPDAFGLMLPAGWAGGFGTAAAIGGSLEHAGFEGATSLGFTSATMGVFVCIIGGLAIARWGATTGKTTESLRPDELPSEMKTGLISLIGKRPSIGTATSSPSSLDSLALHFAVIALTTFLGYVLVTGINAVFPMVSIPLFGAAFAVGLVGRLIVQRTRAKRYIDSQTVGSLSGSATDLLVAFGIASIVPAIVLDYALPLGILLAFGLVYCILIFRFLTPKMFGQAWFERGLFSWGWSTASVATGLALLKIVDPRGKSRTIEDYSLAYVGFAPIEIAMAIVAPVLVTTGFGWPYIITCLVTGVAVIVLAFALGWTRSTPAPLDNVAVATK